MEHGADRTPKAGLAVSASGSTPAQEGPVNLHLTYQRPGEGQCSGREGATGGGPDVGGPLKPDAHTSTRLIDIITNQRNGIRLAHSLLEKVLPLASELSPSLRKEIVHGLFELENYL